VGTFGVRFVLTSFALAWLTGCALGVEVDAPTPELSAFAPAVGFTEASHPAELRGERLSPRIFQALKTPGGLGVDAEFQAFLGDTPLDDVAWVDLQTITATVPAGLPVGTYDVRVVTPEGQEALLEGAYTSSPFAPPTLEGVAPGVVISDAPTTVELSGSGFVDGLAVVLGELELVVESVADTAARALVPAGLESGTYAVSVVNPDGQRAAGEAAVEVRGPAELELVLTPERSRVSVGQAFAVTGSVDNDGETAAQAVTLTAAPGEGAGAADLGETSSADVASGAAVDLTAQYVATTAGELRVGLAAAGVNEHSGRPVSSSDALSTVIVVEEPAALEAAVTTVATVGTGAECDVEVRLTNTGQARVTGAAPQAPVVSPAGAVTFVGGPTPTSADLAGGASATFTLRARADIAGTATLEIGGAGVEENTGAGVVAEAGSATVEVLLAPFLTGAWTTPAHVSTGQTFNVSLEVINSGGAAALAVAPDPSTLGLGACVRTTDARDVPAGGSDIFTYACDAGANAGTGTVSATLSASNFTGPTVTSDAIGVEAAAALVVTLVAPAVVSTGQAFVVEVTVDNAGEATAAGVDPGALGVGGATGTTCGAAAPLTADVAGAASQVFTFTCTAGATAGGGGIGVTATGEDANSGQSISGAASDTFLVEAAVALEGVWTTPASVVGGAQFAATLRVFNNGDADATAASVSAVVLSGAAAIGTSCGAATPGATVIAGGGAQDFAFVCTAGIVDGDLLLTASGSGDDENSGAQVQTGAVTSDAIAVEGAGPPVLSLSWTVPFVAAVGAQFDIKLTVTNSGGRQANLIEPRDFVIAAGVTGMTCGAHAPSSADIPGGESRDFTYSCRAAAEGAASFSAGVQGLDSLDDSTVFALPTSSGDVVVVAPSQARIKINEMVADPQLDWSDSVGGDGIPFNDVPGTAAGDDDTDEWVELVNLGEPVDLTGFVLGFIGTESYFYELGVNVDGQVLVFSDGGSLTNFQTGEYLVIGHPVEQGNANVKKGIFVQLKDDQGLIVDQMSTGNANEDGDAADNAPTAEASGPDDEAVFRAPDGRDTDVDIDDFAQGFGTIGSRNGVCGDGFVTAGEACDDGDLAGGDGCEADCAVTGGFLCHGAPSVCALAGDVITVGPGKDFADIASAVASAVSGETIFVFASTSTAIVELNGLDLTIVGEPGAVLATTSGFSIEIIGGASVFLQGLEVSSSSAVVDDTLIDISGADARIVGCRLGPGPGDGIRVDSNAAMLLRRTRVDGVGRVGLRANGTYDIRHTVVVNSLDNGVQLDGPPGTFRFNTVAANAGSGLRCGEAAPIDASIVFFNGAGHDNNCDRDNRDNNIDDPGVLGNLNQDPRFVVGDFRLQPSSPCIDAAQTVTLAGDDLVDVQGEARPARSFADIGADEVP
jgi:cysteine-rich repeat protein